MADSSVVVSIKLIQVDSLRPTLQRRSELSSEQYTTSWVGRQMIYREFRMAAPHSTNTRFASVDGWLIGGARRAGAGECFRNRRS